MKNHFIFEEGIWVGEGKIKFSILPGELNFRMHWKLKREGDTVVSLQKIDIEGGVESLENNIIFSNHISDRFRVILKNKVMQSLNGNGIIEGDTLAWEFKCSDDILEGFEVYKQNKDGYQMRAEYISLDQVKTIISGNIWKKQENQDDC